MQRGRSAPGGAAGQEPGPRSPLAADAEQRHGLGLCLQAVRILLRHRLLVGEAATRPKEILHQEMQTPAKIFATVEIRFHCA